MKDVAYLSSLAIFSKSSGVSSSSVRAGASKASYSTGEMTDAAFRNSIQHHTAL